MSNQPNVGRRVARLIAFSVGGGVALTIAMASASSAQEVAVQDAEVTNVGVAVANTGGNVAVGNASDNEATTDQDANGLVAANVADTSNTSNGTASITTGAAKATGNESSTAVSQSVTGGDGDGVTVAVQEADVVNAGAAVANSGGNIAVGNASDNVADTNQEADGLIAVNTAGTSNSSDGTAMIHTGNAYATGNSSTTGIAQHVDAGDGDGLLVAVQDAEVVNVGFAAANSGLNAALGNVSDNTATTDQDADGLLAFNAADTSNSSDGTAIIHTGNASATGNRSVTGIAQGVSSDDCDDGLEVVWQQASVLNLGAAFANSGFNLAVGNAADNVATLVQGAAGFIAFNAGGAGNVSDGLAMIVTGNAWAIGNEAWTGISQTA
jgi:hypothetical protein